MTIGELFSMVLATLRDPRAIARAILALDWPRSARWMALALITVLSVIVVQVLQIASGSYGEVVLFGISVSTAIGLGLGQFLMLGVGAYAMSSVGRMFGGTGDLDGAIILLTWLQVVLFVFQVLQLVALFTFPGLLSVFSLAAFGVSFWLLTIFVAELHRFDRLALVFMGILATLFAMGLVFAVLFSAMGLSVVGV